MKLSIYREPQDNNMIKRKVVREKGKIRLSRYFKNFNEGDKVAVVRELSIPADFPSRIQGRTGEIKGRRGKAYIVDLQDYRQKKTYFIEAVHLKKILQK